MNISMNGKLFPKVGLGCMGMSEFYGDTNDKSSLEILKKSYEIGYRHYDTADMYGRGHNETLIGNFIEYLGNNRDEIHLATKVGIQRDSNDKYKLILNGSREHILRSCDESLLKLNTDYLDLYYLHRKDPNISLEESIGTISELIGKGKVGAIGLCEVTSETLKLANNIHKISALQSEYSLWTRDIEDNVINTCIDLDINIFAFSPIGRGFLSGKISKEYIQNTVSEVDFRANLPRFNGENYDKNMSLVNKMKEISDSLGIQASQLAISWILAKNDNIIAIPGTKQEKYLHENFKGAEIVLDKNTIDKLDTIFKTDSVSGDRYPTQILEKSNG